MGRKMDLSALTDEEVKHVLQVVQRDMSLRKEEDKRLSDRQQQLDEEGSHSVLLSRRRCFNQRCCILCCSPFAFLLNPRLRCPACGYNVCKACRAYSKPGRAWLCSACQRRRLLKTQSLEWFYTNVKSRFKRFGSAKVLKNLYKKHSAEYGTLSEPTEGSIYEEHLTDGSVCGSDSAFYRQSEEHSTAETLSVALQVAEDAIDEAISKAEFDTDNQEKQDEAHYLREHRRELIDELAKTIVQKIISRRKSLAEKKQESELNCSPDNIDLYHCRAACSSAYVSLNLQAGLWRSCSALSLLAVDPPEVNSGVTQTLTQELKKEDSTNAMSAWTSVDRLDTSSGPSVLKSPDGNWMALQGAQLARPSLLLTKRKSLVYSALERESGVVSAYDGMGSDAEGTPEPDDDWASALREFQRRMDPGQRSRSPSPGHGRSDGVLPSDTDSSVGRCRKRRRSLLAVYKMPQDSRVSSSRRTSITSVNFNPEGLGEETSAAGTTRRLQKKRRSKKEKDSSSLLHGNLVNKHSGQEDCECQLSDAGTPDAFSSGSATDPQDAAAGGDSVEEGEKEEAAVEGVAAGDQEEGERSAERGEGKAAQEVGDAGSVMRNLCKPVARSSITYSSSSSSDDDAHLVRHARANTFTGEREEEDDGKKREKMANQLSSTEDELDDVVGWRDRKQQGVAAGKEALRRREATLLGACQFSSTEDELYRVDEEERVEETDAGVAEEQEEVGAGDSDVIAFHFGENGILEMTTRTGDGDAGTGGRGGWGRSDQTAQDGTGDHVAERRSWEPLPHSGDGDDDDGDDTGPHRTVSSMPMSQAAKGGKNFPKARDKVVLVKQVEACEETKGRRGEKAHLEEKGSSGSVKGKAEEGGSAVEVLAKQESGRSAWVRRRQEEQNVGNTLDVASKELKRLEWREDEGTKLKQLEGREGGGESSSAQAGQGFVERGAGELGDSTVDEVETEDRDQMTSSGHRHMPSPEEIRSRYSAASLCNITTEVLKVLNATEELLQADETGDSGRRQTADSLLPPNADPRKLHHQFSRLEENVYMTAGAAYRLEEELGSLEECARSVSSATSDLELSFLEEQVASAAAKVQQSELQVSDISARIAALKSAGLNVDPKAQFSKATPNILNSSRQIRRRLPAPPKKDKT